MNKKKNSIICVLTAICLTVWLSARADEPFDPGHPVEPGIFTLTVSANDALMGSVSGSGSYVQGTLVPISASANTGYQFVGWSDGVCAISRTIDLQRDSTITAEFATLEPLRVCPGDQELTIYNNPYTGNIVIRNGAREVVGTYPRDCTPQVISYDLLAAGTYIVEFDNGNRAFFVTKK